MEGTPGVSKTKSTSHIHSVSPSGYNLPAPKITEKTHDALITSGRAVEGKRGYNIPSSRVSSGYNIKPAVSAQRIFQREVGKKEELEKESEGIILVSHPVPAHTILEEKTLLEQLKRERQEHPLEIRLYKNLLEQISEETLSLSQEEAKVYLKDFPPGTCVIIPSGENTSKGDLKEYTLVIKESDSIFKEIPFIASKEKGIVKNADRKLNLHRVRPIPSLREFFREVDREYPLEKSVGQIEKDRQIENLRKELIDVSDERAKNMKKRELIKLLDTGLETSEVDDICDFIEKNRSQYLGENHYIKKHVSKLARTLQFTASGDVYIHLKGKALTPKHAGKDKTGTITVRYNEADIIHNASQKIHKEHEARLNFEESLQRRYNGLEGFLPFHDITSYSVPTKTTEELGVPDVSKKNYLRPYYQGGNVSDLMKAERKDGAVYLVGGYDGSTPRPEIYRTYDVALDLVAPGRPPLSGCHHGERQRVHRGRCLFQRTHLRRLSVRSAHRTRVDARASAGAPAHAIAIAVGSGIDVLGGSPAVSARIDLATSTVKPTHIRFIDANGAVATGKPSYVLGGDVSGRIVGTIWEIAGAPATQEGRQDQVNVAVLIAAISSARAVARVSPCRDDPELPPPEVEAPGVILAERGRDRTHAVREMEHRIPVERRQVVVHESGAFIGTPTVGREQVRGSKNRIAGVVDVAAHPVLMPGRTLELPRSCASALAVVLARPKSLSTKLIAASSFHRIPNRRSATR